MDSNANKKKKTLGNAGEREKNLCLISGQARVNLCLVKQSVERQTLNEIEFREISSLEMT